MTTKIVSSSAALVSALKTAHAGDVIELSPGAYSAISIKNVSFSSAVIITSLNPANPAQLSNLEISNSHNLIFEHMSLSGAAPELAGIGYSSNIGFFNMNLNGAATAKGLVVQNSNNVAIENSNFSGSSVAVTELNNMGVLVSNNHFHDLSGDGVDNGGSSEVLIKDNFFTNFDANGALHPDAIQFWTTNTTASVSRIIVEDNVMTQGTGTTYQGVFISQDSNFPVTFNEVFVLQNKISNGLWNAIGVTGAIGLTVAENMVTESAAQIAADGPTPRIVLGGDTHVVVSGNTAPIFLASDITDLLQLNNIFGRDAVTGSTTRGAMATSAPRQVTSAHAGTTERFVAAMAGLGANAASSVVAASHAQPDGPPVLLAAGVSRLP